MKTAVSIPDDIFERAEKVAAQLGLNRSALYARALEEFLAKQGADPVTATLDAMADDLATHQPPNVGRALIDAGQWAW